VRIRFAAPLFAAALLVARAPHAADDATRRAAVVAHVGPRAITVGELEARLAVVPRFQLQTFGSTPGDVSRKFLDQIIVPEALMALGAEEQHLDQDPAVAYNLQRALSQATMRATRNSVGLASAIPAEEVKAFFDANKERFDMPDRINVFRILCASRDEAQKVLDEAKKDGALPKFTQLARDHSLDKATYLRAGNLGFVFPDGRSNEPGLVVDPAVVKAAQGVHDGEFVAAPVPEGPSFAVVWRRGTVKAMHRTLDDVSGQIRDILWREKKEKADQELMTRLKAKVTEVNESLLGTFDVSVDDGTIGPKRRPGVAPPSSGR
jgi:peptidyl-prolyl cis-trans isomerase C